MTTVTYQRIVDLVRRTLDEEFGQDSCIAATRVTMDVLRAMGVDADALVVETRAFNKPMREAIEAGHPNPLEVEGAWSVGIGVGDGAARPGRVNIHLVAVTDDAILDPTLGQAARPAKGLEIGPSAFPLDAADRADLWNGKPVTYISSDGVAISYRGRPRRRDHTVSPNWGNRDRSLRRRLAGAILRELQKPIDSSPSADTVTPSRSTTDG